MLYGGYGGRILEWGLNVVISILVLISNIFMLIYAVIPVCFSPQNDLEKVNSLILMDNINYLWIVIFQIGFFIFFFYF